MPKPRIEGDEDFNMGENISCNICSTKIIIAEGYYTCLDMCDYDVCKKCFEGKEEYQENEMKCPYDHPVKKRQAGFTKKLKAMQDEDAQESAMAVQFCNSCD